MARPRVDPNDRFGNKVVERFFSKTERKSNGCLEFNSCNDQDGYGRFSVGGRDGKKEYAHIWAFSYANKDNPKILKTLEDGNKVCHKCDNPSCVEEKHLFSGTQKENMEDAAEKGRTNKAPTHFYLNEETVRAIRNSSKTLRETAKEHKTSTVTVVSIQKRRSRNDVI